VSLAARVLLRLRSLANILKEKVMCGITFFDMVMFVALTNLRTFYTLIRHIQSHSSHLAELTFGVLGRLPGDESEVLE